MEDIVLAGFGGHACSVADCIERQGKYKIIGYTDICPKDSRYRYLGTDEILEEYFNQGIRNAAVGVGHMGDISPRVRLYGYLKSVGYKLPAIIDPSAVVSEETRIGEGVFIGKGTVVNVGVEIGRMAIVNTKALVEHECRIGDFAHIAVAAVLCGRVEVGESAFVGASVTVIQGMHILPKAFIPAGIVVRRKGKMGISSGKQNRCGGGNS